MLYRLLIAALVLCVLGAGFEIYAAAQARAVMDRAPRGFFFGPEDADVTVVEFFDYSCAHCRAADPAIMDAVSKDGRARFIPRPMAAVASPNGKLYAQAVYAAGLQGKFPEMHHALMAGDAATDFNEAARTQAAQKAGVDAAKLEEDMKSPKIAGAMAQNAMLLNFYRAPSFPVFVINGKLQYAPGETTPTTDDFLKLFAQARKDAAR